MDLLALDGKLRKVSFTAMTLTNLALTSRVYLCLVSAYDFHAVSAVEVSMLSSLQSWSYSARTMTSTPEEDEASSRLLASAASGSFLALLRVEVEAGLPLATIL